MCAAHRRLDQPPVTPAVEYSRARPEYLDNPDRNHLTSSYERSRLTTCVVGGTGTSLMTDQQYEIGDAELEVMTVLWDEGPCTVRQVMKSLHESGRRVAYTTVLTFLTRLAQKGIVSSDKASIAYIYRAAVTRERVRRSRLKTLMSQLYDGEAAPLVLQLMKTQKFSKDEVTALRELIKQLDSKTKPRD